MLKGYRGFITNLMVIMVVCTLFVQLTAQQFYPNGRYGRRGSMPPLQESTREMALTFFGDGSVRCFYSGFSDYYRCNRIDVREESAMIE